MSVPLTFNAVFTGADIDAMGCIFPHPAFPR